MATIRGAQGVPGPTVTRADAHQSHTGLYAHDAKTLYTNTLAERVRATIGEDRLSGHYFLFRSRRGDRLKILAWDRDGFVLWYKRLKAGVSSCRA